jgi:hypothetical protein
MTQLICALQRQNELINVASTNSKWNIGFSLLPVLACFAACLISSPACAEETAPGDIRADAGGKSGAGSGAVAEGRGITETPAKATPGHGQRHHEGSTLEDRVQALTQGLDLDMGQQTALRKVLVNQREQVMKVWNDPSPVPAAYRIAAVKALTDHTADQIRTILNDEQRKKYNPPPRPTQETEQRPDVSAWMDAMRHASTTTAR